MGGEYLKTEKDSYTLSYLEQEIEIPVVSNTDFSIEIENGISWIQVLETKAIILLYHKGAVCVTESR